MRDCLIDYVRQQWRKLPSGRFDLHAELLRIDPEKYSQQIYHDLVFKEFPFDFNLSLALALYRDFAIPEISEVLIRTGKMERHAAERMNGTASLLLEILVHGLDQPRGISAIRNINRIHRQVASLVDDPGRVSLMSNENFIYVLGTFFIPSIRWIDKYAWRPLSKNEQAGTFAHFRELGSRLGVKDIPPSYEAFVQGFDAYERERMRYTPASGKLWNAGEELLADKLADSLPWPFSRSDFLCRKLADWSVCSLLDDAVRIALGAPRAPMLVRWAVVAVMKCHGKVVRFMRPRKSPLISKGVFVTATE